MSKGKISDEKYKTYIDEDKLQNLNNIIKNITNLNPNIGNKIYNNIIKFFENNIKQDNIQYNNSIRYELNQYIKTLINILSKTNGNNINIIYEVFNYTSQYAQDNLNYKLNTYNNFKNILNLENMIIDNSHKINPFKKLQQVLSIKFRQGNKKTSKELYENSISNTIQQKAKKIINLINDLNHKSEIINQKPLFKPTTKSMKIVSELPDLIIDNEKDLSTLSDYLYPLFWENSTLDQYREKSEEAKKVNIVRREYHHDLDHGEKRRYHKKNKELKETFKLGCNKPFPETAKDWQKVQLYIYNNLLIFLGKIEIEEQ